MLKANPINVRRIDHVVLRTTDLERMVAFYSEVLGCRLERAPADFPLAQLRAGSSLIDILDVESSSQTVAPATNMDHLCLLIEPWDEERILAYLASHGVAVGEVASRYGALGRGPSLYVHDPDGNTVELKGPASA